MKVLFSPNNQKDLPLWNHDNRNPRRDEVVELMTRFGLHGFVGAQTYPPKYGGRYDLFERTCLAIVDMLHFCLHRKDQWVKQTISRLREYQQVQEQGNQKLAQSGAISDAFAQELSEITGELPFDRPKAERRQLETMIWVNLVVDETGPMMESYATKLVDLMLEREILAQQKDRYDVAEYGVALLEKLTVLMGVKDLIGRTNYRYLSQILLKRGFDYFEKHPEELNTRQDG